MTSVRGDVGKGAKEVAAPAADVDDAAVCVEIEHVEDERNVGV